MNIKYRAFTEKNEEIRECSFFFTRKDLSKILSPDLYSPNLLQLRPVLSQEFLVVLFLWYEFIPGPETSLFLSSTYVELYRTSTCCGREFFRACFKTRIRFRHTMVAGGFGPYRRLRPIDAPTECADIIPTPRAMMPALGFVSYRWGHELVVTPPTRRICLFFF